MKNYKNLDDLVFENRNKEYGAYQLRHGYHATLNRSLLITLGVFGLFTGLVLVLRQAPAPSVLPPEGIFKVILYEIPPVTPETTPAKPPAAPVPPDQPARQLENTYQVVDKVPDVPVAPPSTPDVNPAAGDGAQHVMPGTGTGPVTGTGTMPVDNILPTSDMEAFSVDQAPEFPGGLEKFYAYLRSKLSYTARGLEEGVGGKVYASFVIGPDGKPRDVKILKGLGFGLDEQVLKALSQSPSWRPGIYKGKPVSVIYRIPVAFEPSK